MTAIERLKEQLTAWRARIDHLRVQANLGKMEARDELRALGERLEPEWRDAKRVLDSIVESGTTEARALEKSVAGGVERAAADVSGGERGGGGRGRDERRARSRWSRVAVDGDSEGAARRGPPRSRATGG